MKNVICFLGLSYDNSKKMIILIYNVISYNIIIAVEIIIPITKVLEIVNVK